MMDSGWCNKRTSLYKDVFLCRDSDIAVAAAATRSQFPPHLAEHLSNVTQLEGHGGCVNRLVWNKQGSLLASGSDDRKVLLWHYPEWRRRPVVVNTKHDLNIFGVEFLPGSGDSKLVTCAYDRTVQLHVLDRAPAAAARRKADPQAPRPDAADCHSTVFSNHSESVKDVAVEENNPNCFWSAGEDGRVHQFDVRCPEHADPSAHNMLIKAPAVARSGHGVEFKSLDMNRVRPWLMATACSDRFVRVYDRRRLSLRAPTTPAATEPLLALAPLHLLTAAPRSSLVYTTCARFSNKGDQIIATYHRDQAYAFDVSSVAAPQTMQYACCLPDLRALESAARKDDREGPFSQPWHDVPLAGRAAALRSEANECVFKNDWHAALAWYDALLDAAPWFAQGYAARAVVLLRRGWRGDLTAALRDADTCVALSPEWHKAYETRVRCLEAFDQIETALTELDLFAADFQEEARSEAVTQLRARLEQKLAERQQARRRGAASGWGPATDGMPPPSRGFRDNLRASRVSADYDLPSARSSLAAPSSSGINAAMHGARDTRSTMDIPDSLMGTWSGVSRGVSHAGHDGDGSARAALDSSARWSSADSPSGRGFRTALQSSWGRWCRTSSRGGGSPTGDSAAGDTSRRNLSTADRDMRSWRDHANPGASDDGPAVGPSAPRRQRPTMDVIAEASTDLGPRPPSPPLPDPSDAFRAATNPADNDSDSDSDSDSAPDNSGDTAMEGDGARSPGAAVEVLSYLYGHVPYGSCGAEARPPPGLPIATGADLEALFAGAMRTTQRYVGHCNMRTDIKEAVFVGGGDAVVACGSDNGQLFLYDARSGRLLRTLWADHEVVNCVQCHPTLPVLATSGLQDVVKLWEVDVSERSGDATRMSEAARQNQEDMDSAQHMFRGAMDLQWIEQLSQRPEVLSMLNRRGANPSQLDCNVS